MTEHRVISTIMIEDGDGHVRLTEVSEACKKADRDDTADNLRFIFARPTSLAIDLDYWPAHRGARASFRADCF